MKKIVCWSLALLSCLALAQEQSWLKDEQMPLALKTILRAMSPDGAAKGSIFASPSLMDPNYFYHWVRDAGLITEALMVYYETFATSSEKPEILQKLIEHFEFNDSIQMALVHSDNKTLTEQGEPKVFMSGVPFDGSWGRPQSDGPALRAISMLHLAAILKKEGRFEPLHLRFYDARIPADSVIKRDLEYISHNWKKPTFDVWEEALGDHFYTRMVQRRALLEGAEFARSEKDAGDHWYYSQGKAIEESLNDFIEGDYILPTVAHQKGPVKAAKIDSVVLLGILHGLRPGEVIHLKNGTELSITSPIVKKLVDHIKATFQALYPINARPGVPGITIGRYPEDTYTGNGFGVGNPWVLATLAMAEWHYRLAAELASQGDHGAARAEMAHGNDFVERVKYHKNGDGTTSEQIHREYGHMIGARELTWNCAAFLTTANAFDEATKKAMMSEN
jgi:glucoamylase